MYTNTMFKSIIINIHKFIHIIGIPCILQIKLFKSKLYRLL